MQQSIQPQNVAITMEICTLNDVEKLLGNINWIQMFFGIDNQTLAPLFELLKGDIDINVPQKMTNVARMSLSKVEEKI